MSLHHVVGIYVFFLSFLTHIVVGIVTSTTSGGNTDCIQIRTSVSTAGISSPSMFHRVKLKSVNRRDSGVQCEFVPSKRPNYYPVIQIITASPWNNSRILPSRHVSRPRARERGSGVRQAFYCSLTSPQGSRWRPFHGAGTPCCLLRKNPFHSAAPLFS